MIPEPSLLVGLATLLVALDLAGIGIAVVNARLAKAAATDANAARDTARAARADLRNLRDRVVQVETTQEHRAATDGGHDPAEDDTEMGDRDIDEEGEHGH
jgi:hypothetical protein